MPGFGYLPLHFSRKVILIILLCLLLSACSGKPVITPTPSPSETPTSAPTESPLPSPTAAPPTREPSPTIVPVEVLTDPQDLVVFSAEDGKFNHLFAFSPVTNQTVRLTDAAADDITPSLSPDGMRIAFSSRRNGFWNIHILNLQSGEITRITDTPEYEGSPSWSPDGAWLAYDVFYLDHFEILIQSVLDPASSTIDLYDGPGSDHSPAWSPNGREIAFISDRSGWDDVWLARLDDADHRFVNISQSAAFHELDPAWSPDGTSLAWSGSDLNGTWLFTAMPGDPAIKPQAALPGSNPAWSPDGSSILITQADPNQVYLTAIAPLHNHITLPIRPVTGSLQGIDWGKTSLPLEALASLAGQENISVWDVSDPPADGMAARAKITKIENLSLQFPYLTEQAAPAFGSLRAAASKTLGWDLLANVQYLYIPLTTSLEPGLEPSWLRTGRAFSINPLPLQAGWMAVSRENFAGMTYWHLYVRTRFQDGSQGMPVKAVAWDFNARLSSDEQAYEQGGKVTLPPDGYWVDLTTLARRFGWERLPAQPNWRAYYPGARFTQFIYPQGLSWDQAMQQLYPPEALSTPSDAFATTPLADNPAVIQLPENATPRPTWTPSSGTAAP